MPRPTPLGKSKPQTDQEDEIMVPQTSNPIDDLLALHETAHDALKQGDSNSALLHFRGIVHEADSILRRKYESEDHRDLVLGSSFHAVYGDALHQLGMMSEQVQDYLVAAEERFNQVEECDRDNFYLELQGKLLIDKVCFLYFVVKDLLTVAYLEF